MRRDSLCALTVLLALPLAAGACAPKGDDAAARAVAEKVTADYAKAADARDADGLASLFAADAVGIRANAPALNGPEEFRAMYRSVFEQASALDFEGKVLAAHGLGDRVVARGEWATTLNPVGRTAPIRDRGGWIALYRKIGDAWKVEWLISSSDQPMPGTTADGADERALVQLEKDWAVALAKADTKALEGILAPDWVASFEGAAFSRPQLLAALRSGAARFEIAEGSEEQASVFGDTAVVHGLVRMKGTSGGKPFDGKSRYTDLFVKRDGRWQAVGGTNTPVR